MMKRVKRKAWWRSPNAEGGCSATSIQLFREPHEEQDPVCKECDPKDDRYRKKVIGMEIIRNMVKDRGGMG